MNHSLLTGQNICKMVFLGAPHIRTESLCRILMTTQCGGISENTRKNSDIFSI